MPKNNIAISQYKIKRIVECFCLDLTATQTSKLLRINRNTVNKYFNRFRSVIYTHQMKEFHEFVGDVEVDESYFGASRVKGRKGKRGRGTFKQPVFGIFERNGRVYTEVVPDCKKRTLRRIIARKVSLESTIFSDSWRGYDGLVDVGYSKHLRIKHKDNQFSKNGVHINGIESFWSFTKRRLTKFNGTKKNFHLHLKECEWRWSKSSDKLQSELLNLLKC